MMTRRRRLTTLCSSAHDDVQSLDPETGQWSRMPSLGYGRHGTGAVFYDGSLWVVSLTVPIPTSGSLALTTTPAQASGCGGRGGPPDPMAKEVATMEQMRLFG